MRRRHLLLLAFAVVALHGAFFWLVANAKVLPQTREVPRDNFTAHSAEIVGADGEKETLREFTVSTKFVKIPPVAETPQ